MYVQVFLSLPKGRITLNLFVLEDYLQNVIQNGLTPLLRSYLT